MNSLKVLDVTLRDGGCVNDFNFGQAYMTKILAAQERAGIDIIELGYLDEKKGSQSGRTQYINEQVITECLLTHKKPGIEYVAMMDYGKFTPSKLRPKTKDGIDGIRIAFHKEAARKVIEAGRQVILKGYKLYVQPMITLRYSDSELLELISLVNRELPELSGFYIVDSFGEMRPNDMNRVLNLVDHNLAPSITLGFHSHNNLQMSYSNACAMLSFPTNRDIILDSSIMGMGKGAGNLNTELLLEHLNMFYGKHYKIFPLLEVIDEVINQLHNEYYWGYAVEYYLSSVNHCTPSYARHFYSKHMLPIEQVGELLGLVAEDKRISFDRDYAEELYRTYNESRSVNDDSAVSELGKLIAGKSVLLLAPGKSLGEASEEIKALMSRDDVAVIALNVIYPGAEFLLATRADIFRRAVSEGLSVIVPSNLNAVSSPNVRVLNYGRWVEKDHEVHDSSFIIAANLVKAFGVVDVMLAGFDGFSADINENYLYPDMRRPLDSRQAKSRNEYYREFVRRLRDSGIRIEFLTPSAYDFTASESI